MTEAVQRVRTGEVTQAVRDAVGEGGPIKAGDWIAISRDETLATRGDKNLGIADDMIGGER